MINYTFVITIDTWVIVDRMLKIQFLIFSSSILRQINLIFVLFVN